VSGPTLHRVDFLTDGVFAIVATLLVLEIHVPEIPEHHTQSELWDSLADVAPSFVAFAFSFLTILIYWVNHESLSRVTTHYPYRLVWINLLLLLFISLIPFTTDFISEYPREPAASFTYGLVMFLTAVTAVIGYWYVAFGANLMSPQVSREARVRLLRRMAFGPALYLVATFAALLSVYVSIAIYIAIPLLFFVPAIQESLLEELGEE
jgi:uncharacterized membrane protein